MPRPSTILHNRQAILERRRQVASFRVAGIRDQHAIAQQLHVSVGTINGDFKALDQQYVELAASDIAREKGLDLERVETLVASLWRDAKSGKLGAIDRVIDLLGIRARLLGLEAPRRSEISGPDGGAIEIDHHVSLTDDQRRERIAYLFERESPALAGPVSLPEAHLDTPEGSTNGSVAH